MYCLPRPFVINAIFIIPKILLNSKNVYIYIYLKLPVWLSG